MKKAISVVLCILMLLSAISVSAFAGSKPAEYQGVDGPAFTETAQNVEICPDKPLDVTANIPAFTEGSFTVSKSYAEIKTAKDEDFTAYTNGTKLGAEYNGAAVRYVLEFNDGVTDYVVYSTEATLTVEHRGCGKIQYDDDGHWRICEKCGEKCEQGYHSFNEGGVCTVCGASDQYSKLESIFNFFGELDFLEDALGIFTMVIQILSGLIVSGL